MDVQVLNEIANQARQASLSQVRASVSANAQLKALKGNPVPAPENPAPPPFEDAPEQAQGPVTPEISSVARAASAYSAAVGDGLNPDELGAIQDLAGRVRTAVSDFLSQPGLEQAESAAAVVASNPEAVQELTATVEQAVVETLNLPELEGEAIVNANPPNTVSIEQIPVPANLVSLERITNGAETNNLVVAADPDLANSRVIENANVENTVTVEDVPEASRGDFRVTAAGLALQNAQARENVPEETPVNQSDAVSTNNQGLPATAANPALVNSRTSENQVTVEGVPETSSGDFTVSAARPAVPNVPADENVPAETRRPEVVAVPQQESVSRPETVAANPQEVPVPAVRPAVPNTQTDEHVPVETPVSRPEAVAANPQEAPVIATNQALPNTQAQNAEVGNPVNIPASSVDQGQGSAGGQAQAVVNPERAIASPEGAGSLTAPSPSTPQPAPSPQPGTAQSNDLFAQENAAVNPENIRNANELVNSVVDNEFTSEAKKIFSEPKVIRTVADLADFILERLREIIAAKQFQRQSQSSGETGLS